MDLPPKGTMARDMLILYVRLRQARREVERAYHLPAGTLPAAGSYLLRWGTWVGLGYMLIMGTFLVLAWFGLAGLHWK